MRVCGGPPKKGGSSLSPSRRGFVDQQGTGGTTLTTSSPSSKPFCPTEKTERFSSASSLAQQITACTAVSSPSQQGQSLGFYPPQEDDEEDEEDWASGQQERQLYPHHHLHASGGGPGECKREEEEEEDDEEEEDGGFESPVSSSFDRQQHQHPQHFLPLASSTSTSTGTTRTKIFTTTCKIDQVPGEEPEEREDGQEEEEDFLTLLSPQKQTPGPAGLFTLSSSKSTTALRTSLPSPASSSIAPAPFSCCSPHPETYPRMESRSSRRQQHSHEEDYAAVSASSGLGSFLPRKYQPPSGGPQEPPNTNMCDCAVTKSCSTSHSQSQHRPPLQHHLPGSLPQASLSSSSSSSFSSAGTKGEDRGAPMHPRHGADPSPRNGGGGENNKRGGQNHFSSSSKTEEEYEDCESGEEKVVLSKEPGGDGEKDAGGVGGRGAGRGGDGRGGEEEEEKTALVVHRFVLRALDQVPAGASISDHDVHLLHKAHHPDPFGVLGCHEIKNGQKEKILLVR